MSTGFSKKMDKAMKRMTISKVAIATAAALAFVNIDAAAPTLAGHPKAKAQPVSCPELNAIDPDNDGAMTRLEALRAGKKAFYRLNTDKDRTLEADELAGRMSARAFDKADSIIKDGKVGLIEYLREVKNRFHWANPDKDRTIECDELHTKYGRLLYRLLR
jgi:hypothetical protein